MVWWQAALWALAGGFVVEGLEFAALQRRHRKWPWQVDAEAAAEVDGAASGPAGYFIAELVRLAAGGVLGAALAGQITAPLPALAIGAAAPIIAGHLTAYIPLPPAPPQVGVEAPASDPAAPPATRPADAGTATSGTALGNGTTADNPAPRASNHGVRMSGNPARTVGAQRLTQAQGDS